MDLEPKFPQFKKGDLVRFPGEKNKIYKVTRGNYFYNINDFIPCVDLEGYKGEVGVFYIELYEEKKPKIFMVSEKYGVAAESEEEALIWFLSLDNQEFSFPIDDVKEIILEKTIKELLYKSLNNVYQKPFLVIGEL